MSYISSQRYVNFSAIQRLEYFFAVIGIFFFSTGLPSILASAEIDSLDTPLRYSIILISIFGISLNLRKSLEATKRGQLIWPLFFLIVASAAWSINPAVSVQSLRSDFIPATIFGLYLAIRFERREIFNLLYISVLIGSLFSVFYAIFIPSIGRHPLTDEAFPGAWKGIFEHKNGLGFNLALTNVCLGLKIIYNKQGVLWKNLSIFIGLICAIVVSSSLSALAISSLVLILVWLYGRYRWRGKTTALLLNFLSLFSAISIGALVALWIPLMNALGKDPTLTGRTLIWGHLVGKRVADKPILGYGRAAVWKDPSIYNELYQASHHVPSHAHNGYVDLMLDVGYGGLILFLISLFSVLKSVLKLAYKATHYENIWPLAFIIFLILYNITESVLLRGASLTWVIYISIACSDLTPSTNHISNP